MITAIDRTVALVSALLLSGLLVAASSAVYVPGPAFAPDAVSAPADA